MNDIEMAQVEAGENAVVERLRRKGPIPPIPDSSAEEIAALDAMNRREDVSAQRHALEHSLATGFIKLQKERDPAARQAQWVELQRLASEIERLSE